MIRLILVLGVVLILPPLEARAQTDRASTCSVTQVLKLLDAGYTKLEIERLCHADEQSAPQVMSPQPPKQPKQDIATLNGNWTISSNCSPFEGAGYKISVTAGKIAGWIYFGADDLRLEGQFSSNGSVEIFGSGKWVLGTFKGQVTDWSNGAANGTLNVGGEAYCDGTWHMKKTN